MGLISRVSSRTYRYNQLVSKNFKIMEELRERAPYDRVIVHPLVLLSGVDHFNRIGNVSRNSRVVGALLGSTKIIDGKRVLDVSNCFAVPFDEDSKDEKVWFLDHDYLDTMFNMFRKVNAKERIVGWYHTGPELHASDTEINDIFKKYTPNSVLCVVETTTNDWSLPTRAYYCVEEVNDDGKPSARTFNHLSVEIGAEEAEEVGVEHLCRDVFTNTQGSLSARIAGQIKGLKGFGQKLEQIGRYLNDVASGKLPMNYKIIYGLQDIFNLLPDVTGIEFNKAMQQVSNDQMLIVYLSSMIKSVIALHNLIDNKLDMNEKEREEEKKDEEARKKKQEEKEAKQKAKLEEAGDKKGSDKAADEKSTENNKSNNKNSGSSSAKKSNLAQLFYQEQMTSLNCRAMAELIEKSEPKSSKLCSF